METAFLKRRNEWSVEYQDFHDIIYNYLPKLWLTRFSNYIILRELTCKRKYFWHMDWRK